MLRTTPEQNKALVLEAFDTLFNKRDYAAAERFWSPEYVQHSAHIGPGREGLFNLIRSVPPSLRYENQLILAPLHWYGARQSVGRGRCRALRRRALERTLGRAAGRGDRGGVSQRSTHVRRHVPWTGFRTLNRRRRHMKLSGNTIFITGGGSGIGRALAEQLHQRGNTVIISGRRKAQLDSVTAANPGMSAIELDITSLPSIESAAGRLIDDFPALNVLINNAGIMEPDEVGSTISDDRLQATVNTNLLGPIRLTSALIEHLKRTHGTIIYNTSVLAFVPLAVTAVYSATKAALHSYVLSQRFLLRSSGVRVLELAPPWVRTELMNSQEAEQAMPLDAFITETMKVLETDTDEVLVEIAKPFRANPGVSEHALVSGFNEQMLTLFGGSRNG